MALPHNIANYTIPGGIKLFFDDGTGERDLGNIVNVEMTPGTDELEHYSNRSGKRTKDHSLILEEKLEIKFQLDEPVAEHWRYFFKGDALTNVGAGTAAITDQKETLTGVVLQSLEKYGLSAVTVRQFLDACLVYDGSAYTDKSAEADSLAGTPFGAMDDSSDYLYIGKLTKFKQAKFDFDTLGSYTGFAAEYWDGATWSALSLTDGTSGFSADGVISWTSPGDWALTTVNSLQYYWVRFKCSARTTQATILAIRQNGVANTDYILDPGIAGSTGRVVGRVGRLSGGMFEDGEEVKVSFTYTTWTSQRFNIAGAGSFVGGSARLECHPSAGRGLSFDIEIPKCQIKPDGSISLDDKEWLQQSFILEVLDNSELTPTYPMGRVVVYETS